MKAGWLLAFCWLSLPAQADLLSEVAGQIQRTEYLSGQFQQEKHIQVLPLPLVSTGVFQYQRGEGVVWELQTPTRQTLTIDAGRGGGRAAVKGKPRDSMTGLVERLLFSVFSGDLAALQGYFSVAAKGQTSDWELQLTPLGQTVSQFIGDVRIYGGRHLSKVTIMEANGDSTVIDMSIAKASVSND
ncbi:MAG: outer membrane lipoprotein carrier protein LolA [Pseudomonadales bacterium]